MWYKASNGNLDKPDILDTTSSKFYVYVRKNFEIIEEAEETPAHYQYDEMLVSKEDWTLYEQVINNSNALDDVYEALYELAELIVGG